MPNIPLSAVSDKVLVQTIVAAISEVHGVLGPGLMDTVYEEALAREFSVRKINHQRQAEISLVYKETLIGRHSVNFLVEGRVLVEFQTLPIPLDVYQARLHSFLKAANKRVALLVDFNVPDIRKGVKIAYTGTPKKGDAKRKGRSPADQETVLDDSSEEE